jgi:Fanconi anemia group M protein
MKKAAKKEENIVIYMDSREMKTRVAAILEKHCTVEIKNLDCADYLLSEGVAAERKTTADFLQSLTDGRLFEQLSRMKESFASPLLIIEGGSLFEDSRKIHPNAIRGALASVAIDMAVPMIWTENQLETARILHAIAKREQVGNKKAVAIRGRKKLRSMNHQQEFLLSGIEGINTSKAKNLLKHFSSPEKIFSATEEELKKTGGIGPELAKKIRKVLSSRYEKSILED